MGFWTYNFGKGIFYIFFFWLVHTSFFKVIFVDTPHEGHQQVLKRSLVSANRITLKNQVADARWCQMNVKTGFYRNIRLQVA